MHLCTDHREQSEDTQIFIDIEICEDKQFINIIGKKVVAIGCGLPFFILSQIVGIE